MLEQVVFSESEWLQLWREFDPGSPRQAEALKMLRQHILQSDPTLLARNAEWVEGLRGVCRI